MIQKEGILCRQMKMCHDTVMLMMIHGPVRAITYQITVMMIHELMLVIIYHVTVVIHKLMLVKSFS